MDPETSKQYSDIFLRVLEIFIIFLVAALVFWCMSCYCLTKWEIWRNWWSSRIPTLFRRNGNRKDRISSNGRSNGHISMITNDKPLTMSAEEGEKNQQEAAKVHFSVSATTTSEQTGTQVGEVQQQQDSSTSQAATDAEVIDKAPTFVVVQDEIGKFGKQQQPPVKYIPSASKSNGKAVTIIEPTFEKLATSKSTDVQEKGIMVCNNGVDMKFDSVQPVPAKKETTAVGKIAVQQPHTFFQRTMSLELSSRKHSQKKISTGAVGTGIPLPSGRMIVPEINRNSISRQPSVEDVFLSAMGSPIDRQQDAIDGSKAAGTNTLDGEEAAKTPPENSNIQTDSVVQQMVREGTGILAPAAIQPIGINTSSLAAGFGKFVVPKQEKLYELQHDGYYGYNKNLELQAGRDETKTGFDGDGRIANEGNKAVMESSDATKPGHSGLEELTYL